MILAELAALSAALLWAVASVQFTREAARTRPVIMNLDALPKQERSARTAFPPCPRVTPA